MKLRMHVHVLLHVLLDSKLPLTNRTLVLLIPHVHIQEMALQTKLTAEVFQAIVHWTFHQLLLACPVLFVEDCIKFGHHALFQRILRAAYVTEQLGVNLVLTHARLIFKRILLHLVQCASGV
jgi:hypothetical protein